jgi:ferritin-like metal-binding protein YciE
MDQRGDLIKWLNNAYASEMQIVEILKNHVEEAKDYHDVKNKIQEHLELSKDHVEQIKKCIIELGGEVSNMKSGSIRLIEELSKASSGIIENAAKAFAIENYELALYSVIHRYAEELDEEEVMDTIESIMDEEMDMADWLDTNLSELVDTIISKGIDESELLDEDRD